MTMRSAAPRRTCRRASATARSGAWPWRCSTSSPAGAWRCRRSWPMPATVRSPPSAPPWPSAAWPTSSRSPARPAPTISRSAAEQPPWRGSGRRPARRYRAGALLAARAGACGRARGDDRDRLARGLAGPDELPLSVPCAADRPTSACAARTKSRLPAAWLLAEWPDGQAEPVKYWLANLPEATGLGGARAPGQAALADRARLPRAQGRPGPRPLRGPLLSRLAPPRHPGQRWRTAS